MTNTGHNYIGHDSIGIAIGRYKGKTAKERDMAQRKRTARSAMHAACTLVGRVDVGIWLAYGRGKRVPGARGADRRTRRQGVGDRWERL